MNPTLLQFKQWLILFLMSSMALSATTETYIITDTIFTDNGGEDGVYLNNTRDTFTFIAEDQSKLLAISFEYFEIESGDHDFFYIFDGLNTDATLIGRYNDTRDMPTITSSNNDGALTFVFTSDVSINKEGWKATISQMYFWADFTSDKVFSNTNTDIIHFYGTARDITASSWSWDMNSDGQVDYNTQNPSHTFATEGTHAVTLTVTDNNNRTTTITKEDFITIRLPYTLTDGDVTVTNGDLTGYSYNFANKDIIIPNNLDGQEITAISASFFNEEITSVELPNTLTSIGYEAFKNNDIETITIPASVKTLYGYTFHNNNADTVLFEAGSQLEKIMPDAFSLNKFGKLILPRDTVWTDENGVHYEQGTPISDFFIEYRIGRLEPFFVHKVSSSIIFLDNGGEYGDYRNYTTEKQTYIAQDTLNSLQVTFDTIDIEEIWDSLYVYDGVDTDAPLLATFSGEYPDSSLISTDSALTFVFTSDGSDQKSGWKATISQVYLGDVFTVSFTINDGTNPIAGAEITLTGYGSATTDASGQASFDNVRVGSDITYTIIASGYSTQDAQLSVVDADINKTTSMTAIATSLDESSKQSISLYPNPASSIVNINTTIGTPIQIFDLSGKMALSTLATKDVQEINISSLSPGIYLVKANTEVARLIVE